MGALPRPQVPDGAVRELFDHLHGLHHRAGWPSLREMAKEIGCSHTTVWAAFCEPRVPRWGLLELIVETLGGDVAAFHRLWLSASTPATGAPAPPRSAPFGPSAVPADRGVRSPDAEPVHAAITPPRQLPADVVAFTGREEPLAVLDGLLAEAAGVPALPVAVICGTAGVGKTALALHWAHRVAGTFPDGQLYLDLRGYDPDQPLHPSEALEALLRLLGEPGAGIPRELPERAARYRSVLAGRRLLVVLDNAYSVEQVRDLLPGSATCFVVVTSRDTLPALVARHGATRIGLDLLSAAEAMSLLRTLVGRRVDEEPDAARALTERCARLPLAIRIAAELAASRPRIAIAHLVEELSDESLRLDLLAAGDDDYTAVRTVFSWSISQVDPAAAYAFTVLGLHPGPDVDRTAVAALTGVEPAQARRVIDRLVRSHLLTDRGAGRYDMHDLLHAYAAEQARKLPEADRQVAIARLREHFLHRARAAVAVAFATAPGPTTASTPPFDLAESALSWLDAERVNLLAIARVSSGDGRYAMDLSGLLDRYLDSHSYYKDALALHGLAHDAAVRAGDLPATGAALERLGTVRRRLGDYHGATECYEEALRVQDAAGDRAGAAVTRHGLGLVCIRLGRIGEADEHINQALAIFQDGGDRARAGSALYALALADFLSGRYTPAREHGEHALELLREVGDVTGQGRTLNNLGLLAQRLGDLDGAGGYFQQALDIARSVGNRTGESVALVNLADLDIATGQVRRACERYLSALTLSRQIGYRIGQADALRGLGVATAHAGRLDEAGRHLEEALAICRESGEHETQVRALLDLGDLLRDAARTGEARSCYVQALALANASQDAHTMDQATLRIKALGPQAVSARP